MKRPAFIVGPTPEFVRWSVRQPCALRAETELDSVDQTEKRLRAIRAAGAALESGRVVEGIAVARDAESQFLGFRLADVFDVWGGQTRVVATCRACPANLLRTGHINGSLAGCCGWLDANDRISDWHTRIDSCWRDDCQTGFLSTQPLWYGFWASGPLRERLLDEAIELFERLITQPSAICEPASQFLNVLVMARSRHLVVDVELVPAGSSDGIVWTIARHCDRCRAPRSDKLPVCPVCRKPGRGHPEIKKRVLGRRPWVPLATVLGQSVIPEFVQQHGLDDAPQIRSANDMASDRAE